MELQPIAVYARFRPAVDHTELAASTLLSASARGKLLGATNHLIDYAVEPAYAKDGTLRHFISIKVPEDADPGLFHNNPSGRVRFEFDKVFEANASQETIFSEVVKHRVLEAFLGINCTIFAYGQTGSGKTYTVSGGDTFQDRGLIPRTVGLVFEEIAHRVEMQSHRFKCHVSFAEVYKESVYDLLDPQQRELPLRLRTPVQVLEAEGGLVMKNISVYEVSEERDALSLFFMGISNRIQDATVMNAVSSRSHAIFTLILDSESHAPGQGPGTGQQQGRNVLTSGKINLVDLAGSERMYKMHNTRGLVTEAKSINLSLHFLEQVIVALRDQVHQHSKKQPQPHLSTSTSHGHGHGHGHVPYRNSVLTSVLRDSLGGNCKTCFVLALSAERLHFEETISTCRFGQRCGEVKVQVTANTEVSLIDQLREQSGKIKALEKAAQAQEALRKALQEQLFAEKELRLRACELRPLSNAEQQLCKECVSSLLSAAKTSLALSAASSGAEEASGGRAQAAAEALEQSQEALFHTMAGLDKAVLVELAAAMANLAQGVYVERERSRALQAKARGGSDAGLGLSAPGGLPPPPPSTPLAAGNHSPSLANKRPPLSPRLAAKTARAGAGAGAGAGAEGQGEATLLDSSPAEAAGGAHFRSILAMVQRGDYFMKRNRFGLGSLRHVAVSGDLTMLYWHHMGNVSKPSAMLLSDVERCVGLALPSVSPTSPCLTLPLPTTPTKTKVSRL